MEISYGPLSGSLNDFTNGPFKESAFTVTYSTALNLLERELGMLKAREVTVEVDLAPEQFRLDGRPRQDARARSNKVRLTFESKHGNLTYATDRFVRGYATYWKDGQSRKKMVEDWQHNLYAIALGLEALRKIDRYGIADLGQQYGGWKALEATASGIGPEGAWEIIALAAGVTVEDAKKFRVVTWKQARKNSHPDKLGGDHTAWNRLHAAGKVVGLK